VDLRISDVSARQHVRPVRLAIISTHPIQYYAPIFQELARRQRVYPRVFYTWSQTAGAAVSDPGFARAIQWDIPLLEGYECEFVENVAPNPGTDHFWGVRNPGLNRIVSDWLPQAVLVFGWNCASHLSVLRHFKGKVPVFFRGDSTLLDERSALSTLARRAYLTWVYRHVDVPIAVGANNRDYYLWAGVRPECIAHAPHAIDTRRFADSDGSRGRGALEWRRQLNIAADERVLLFAGKFIDKKDPGLLIDAFIRCGQDGHLVLVGNGALEDVLRSRVAGRGNVHFLPFQNQSVMPAVYRLGDVFVLPSRGPGETWGLALNEAMACGRPVISGSKAGGARDLVDEGVNGWIFESGDAEQLAGVLHRAITCDRQALQRMGEAARLKSVLWSIEAAARGIEDAVLKFAAPGLPVKGVA
jgi:glycosyltransferase involved in cell wall biosynthesis